MEIENNCKNCPYCDIVTDSDYCKRMKCMKTKSSKGKTITWFMCGVGTNVFMGFANYLETHNTPRWCPLKKTSQNT